MKQLRQRNIPIFRVGSKLGIWTLLCMLALFGFSTAHAYENEVWESGGLYYWKINNVQQGSSADLSTAMTRCIWDSSGTRDIHVLTGGDLSATIGVPPDVSLYGHTNTFNVIHGDYTVHARGVDNIGFYDMTITNASHMVFLMGAVWCGVPKIGKTGEERVELS